MNAYWMNKLVYEGTTCPEWMVPVLIALVSVLVVGIVVTVVLVNKN
jgi:hypothetical protein